MNCNGKVRYVIENTQVKNLNELSPEREEKFLSHLQQWKKRAMYAAVEHHLSNKYPNENIKLKWSNEEVKIK